LLFVITKFVDWGETGAHQVYLLDGKEDHTMPTYIGLYKLTDQGVKAIKDAPERVEAAIKGVEKMGGKVTGVYAVMGGYDYVTIGEFPSDEVATTCALALGSLGNVRTTTLRAYTKEEFAAMVKKLP
jgi:uncharacterized protein with GYD domain